MRPDFTERGKRAFQIAQDEALRMGHEVVGTEHILLGLLLDGDTYILRLLAEYGLTADALVKEVEKYAGAGTPREEKVDLPMSDRAKLVMSLAVREAARMRVAYVGTIHIFLALLAEEEGMVARLLSAHGLNLEDCRKFFAAETEGDTQEREEPQDEPRFEWQPPRQPSVVQKTPMLDQLAIDLTQMARKNELDPVIGRSKEIRRVVQILSRRTKNNPVLIGEPGVGKTAVAEGLAQKVVNGDIPEILRGKRVMQLNVANLVAGTKYRGEFEERMRRLVHEIRESKNVILFIDEIHTIVGAGGAEGAVDAANILKPSLARGEFQVVGATTISEYRKYIEKDAALERRFQPVQVDEPTEEETVQILAGLRDRYEAHHGVNITDAALEAAAALSKRYITDRFLPDKAIDLIDEASARARINTLELPDDIKALERNIEGIRKEKESAAARQEFEKAALLRDEERKTKERYEEMRMEWTQAQSRIKPDISAENIASIVSETTGIPVTQLTEEESRRLLHMEEELRTRLVGQDEALCAVARAVRRSRSGMKDPKRPAGSFLFLGPTGVGKTELARSLAEFLFGSEDAMIRMDMSEYMERHEAAKLIGAPPGYVGYEEGGKLTEAVRRKPYSVVLFDEIEKAHPDVFNIMLQLLEDGRLTDGHGHVTDFRNCVVIMTSNVGVSDGMGGRALGFGSRDERSDADMRKMRETILEAAKKTFRPEFLNRIDEILVFSPLGRPELLKIVDIMLKDVIKRANGSNIEVVVDDSAKELILDKGYNPKYGARPLRRTIQKMIEDEISNRMLEGGISAEDKITIKRSGESFDFTVGAKK
ncbi:ATP-dependent Clp protease ATP-binding subunit [Synergistes jonesii]|uniref:ATP-dependent Clp protease ATP-binding subunit n=1 Tax=Synergistes jonesii TaxID=2754 RepID=UPI00248E395A|nr:ATP-dependent Clp protease ATP-binding subunit [Synergistes jonesii]